MIDLVTFTGVDSHTPMQALADLAERYPRVEFGVLVGSHTGEVEGGIFPPMRVVESLRDMGERMTYNTSIHLCGSYARQVMRPEGPSDEIYQMCDGFGRVQVNLHGDAFDLSRIDVASPAVRRFADMVTCQSVILQHRDGWERIPVTHKRVEYLFDRSEGRGLESFDQWPEPSRDLFRMGYAGGIGPHNIDKAIGFAERHPESRIWLDMEGRIRTSDYWLDLAAVRQVCRRVWGGDEGTGG